MDKLLFRQGQGSKSDRSKSISGQSKFLRLLKAMKASRLILPCPSGSQWLIISLTSAGVTSSPSSSAAATRSSSEMNPLASSSKFSKMRRMSSSVSASQGRRVISLTNSLKVISPPSSVSKTDMATQTKGLPGLYPPKSRMHFLRSMGVSIPSQSSSRQSKTCLNISTSWTEHSATIQSLGSKLIAFFIRMLDCWRLPFSGVCDWFPSRELPLPRPNCELREPIIQQLQQPQTPITPNTTSFPPFAPCTHHNSTPSASSTQVADHGAATAWTQSAPFRTNGACSPWAVRVSSPRWEGWCQFHLLEMTQAINLELRLLSLSVQWP